MPLDLNDTIAAIASPPGPAARGIVRISGEVIVDIVRSVFACDDEHRSQAKRATRFEGTLNIPAIGIPLPASLMLWPTSRSYTGQPMAELHTTGSPPLLETVLERVLQCGARHANRGEFTMRAFLAGRIDLVQAEAVLGVIDAADYAELQAALSQLGGGITQTLVNVRNEILMLLGDLEAGLDFVEEDIEFISNQQIRDRLKKCEERLQHLADDSSNRLPAGLRRRVVLAGLPNAGKSTLFNRLLGSQRAIVSPIAGTTRDYLSSVIVLGGVEVELIDTAGWEAAADLIMERAQSLRSEQIHASDLVIWCRAADIDDGALQENDGLRQQLAELSLPVLDVATRWDLVQRVKDDEATWLGLPAPASRKQGTGAVSPTSGETGYGVPDLLAQIEQLLTQNSSAKSELVSSTAARCRDTLRRAIAAINAATAAAEQQLGDEIIAFELRDSLHQIATMLGEVYTDDILDHIFSNFCIGK